MKCTPKELYLCYMELRRMHMEVPAVSIHDKSDFQRQRSSKTDWLEFEADVGKYHDRVAEPYQLAMKKVYWDNGPRAEIDRFMIFVADEGLDKMYDMTPDVLKERCTLIYSRL